MRPEPALRTTQMDSRQRREVVSVADRAVRFTSALSGAAVLASLFLLGVPSRLDAQKLSSGGWKPFVIAVIPVVGRNGAVGGVSIDAGGVLDAVHGSSRDNCRAAAMVPADGEMARASSLRISLRRLEAALEQGREKNQPLPLEMHFLAGLQRIRYVFAYPEAKDIVLAGEAEGWLLNDAGEVVGQTTDSPWSSWTICWSPCARPKRPQPGPASPVRSTPRRKGWFALTG